MCICFLVDVESIKFGKNTVKKYPIHVICVPSVLIGVELLWNFGCLFTFCCLDGAIQIQSKLIYIFGTYVLASL